MNRVNYIKLIEEVDDQVCINKKEEARKILFTGLESARKRKDTAFVELFLGELDAINNEIESAITHYEKAMKQEPYNTFLLKRLGIIHSFNEDEEKAIEFYDLLIKLDVRDYEAFALKGISLSKLNQYSKALDSFNEALNINSNDIDSLKGSGFCLSALDEDENAIDLYNKAIFLDSCDYETFQLKGISLSKLNQNIDALDSFDKALNIYPDDIISLRGKGKSLSELGYDQEAIELYDRAITLDPEDYEAFQLKGTSLCRLRRNLEALNFFDEALNINPDHTDSLKGKGISLSKLERNREAIEFLELAFFNKIHEEINDIVCLKNHGFELKNTGYLEESLIYFARALELNPKDHDSLKEIAYLLKLLGRNEEGEGCLKKVPSIKIFELINEFEDLKENLLNDIDEIETKFTNFISDEKVIPKDSDSFLFVLRRWNSYTPILPSKQNDSKGGGYFLVHKGKGIVIDPGFNFIENFYQRGFKVADIDAVLISHSHNDHTADLESILTLVHKHNDTIKKNVRKEMKGREEHEINIEIEKRLGERGKKIDLFLNLGTFRKYSGLLELKDCEDINDICVLMPDIEYKLFRYNLTIYTTKAKHDEIIDQKYALGFIICLDDTKEKGSINIGFTCDTGWDFDDEETMIKPYKKYKPELVVAHLGSIKRKEFRFSDIDIDEKNKCYYKYHLGLLGMTRFIDKIIKDVKLVIISEFGEELRNYREVIVSKFSNVFDIPCLPADIGLCVRLKDLYVHSTVDADFIRYEKIEARRNEEKEDLTLYFCQKTTENEIFNKRLKEKGYSSDSLKEIITRTIE